MKLTEENRRVLVEREYKKALSFMTQAEGNIQLGYWDTVANRLYYSVFHAISALLINDGHQVGTHKGSVMRFGQHYVKTGIVTADDGALYSRLETMREKADYEVMFTASQTAIEELYPQAKALLKKIAGLVSLDPS